MKNKKCLIIASVLVIAFVLGITGIYIKRTHGGVVIKCEGNYPVNENLILYRQDDPEWESDKLGTSKYTMKSSGCLVTCIAMALSDSDYQLSPGELNKQLTENRVYDEEGNMQWDRLASIEGFQVELYDSVSNNMIDRCLKNHHYPIVRIHRKGNGANHFVLLVGAEENDYICMDPLEDELTRLSDYGSRVYAMRCVWYETQD